MLEICVFMEEFGHMRRTEGRSLSLKNDSGQVVEDVIGGLEDQVLVLSADGHA